MAAITTAFKNSYADAIMFAAQQSESKLRQACEIGRVEGEYLYMDELTALSASEILTRNADTVNVDTDWDRRRVYLRRFAVAPLIDDFDQLMMIQDPKSSVVKATVKAMNRQLDDLIIGAFNADVATGHAGGTTTSYDSSNTVTAGSDLDLTALRSTKKILDTNNLEDENERYIVCSPTQIFSLLNVTQVQSADYNTVKALVNGEIDTFMGFKFIVSNRLTKSGSVRACFAWVKPAMQVGVGKEITTMIDQRPDKNYSWQIYTEMWMGALRTMEEGVCQINCTEA